MRSNQRLIHELQSRGLTLAFAESMTCGMAASSLATVKGVSEVLLASAVCYHESAKNCVLHVPKQLLEKYTAESQQVTDRMAREAGRTVHADVVAAITGLASEGGSETKVKPVGTVFFAVLFRNRLHRARKHFNGSPVQIRKRSCDFIFREIVRIVKRESEE